MSSAIDPRRARQVVVWTLVVWLGTSLSAAGDPLQSLLPPQDSAPRPQLLVLKSGQVLQGEIEAQVGGYSINAPSGRMVVQYSDVRTAAVSLEDAYQRMVANRRNPTANDRIELAQWCVRNGLRTQAQDELLAALVLEPQRLEAKRLLLQIQGQPAASPPPAGTGIDVTLSSPANRARPLPTSGHLSRERIAEFTRQIQPLLLNTCASTACHGGQNGGDFRLRPTARLSRLDTDANLEAVLQKIDVARLEMSPLLTVPKRSDGVHEQAFRGPKSEDQYQRLAAWVRQAAQETAGDAALAQPSASSPVTSTPGIVPAAAIVPGEGLPGVAGAPTVGSGSLSTAAPPPARSDVNDAFLRNILDDSRPDPFDPEVFNRRVHGRPSGRSPVGAP